MKTSLLRRTSMCAQTMLGTPGTAYFPNPLTYLDINGGTLTTGFRLTMKWCSLRSSRYKRRISEPQTSCLSLRLTCVQEERTAQNHKRPFCTKALQEADLHREICVHTYI